MKKLIFVIAIMIFSTNAQASITESSGRKTVTASGVSVQLSTAATEYKQCTICAETDNTGIIAVGDSTVIASLATRTGIPLNAGDCYTMRCENNMICGKLSNVYIDSTVSGDGVTIQYTSQSVG